MSWIKFQGKIETQGTYKELVASQIDFAHLLAGGDEETENKDTVRKLSTQLSIQVSLVLQTFLYKHILQ